MLIFFAMYVIHSFIHSFIHTFSQYCCGICIHLFDQVDFVKQCFARFDASGFKSVARNFYILDAPWDIHAIWSDWIYHFFFSPHDWMAFVRLNKRHVMLCCYVP